MKYLSEKLVAEQIKIQKNMRRKLKLNLAGVVLIIFVFGRFAVASSQEKHGEILEQYTDLLNQLKAELTAKASTIELKKAKVESSPEGQRLLRFLANDRLDPKLVKYVILLKGTPKGLTDFVQRGKGEAALIKQLLTDDELMKQILIADGASSTGRGAPEEYGWAMRIYTDIQKTSKKAKDGVLQRLALAVGLQYAGGLAKKSMEATNEASLTKDALNRYLDYEKAYLGGELDPAFGTFTTWELKFLFGWGDPQGALAWGREMLRNLRPDHIYDAPDAVRYSVIVNTCVKYGSGHVPFDRPELYAGQNIIMHGGVCGRRAAMGRFAVRSFGIPATARPSPRHGALVRWSREGWWPNLGPNWGAGSVWGSKDLWFREYTQARENNEGFMQVKRAHWFAEVLGERRLWNSYQKEPTEGWNGVALRRIRSIIEAAKNATPQKKESFEDIDEFIGPTLAQKVMAAPVTPADREITYEADGTILIPAAACTPRNASPCVIPMKSFAGGLQIFLPRLSTRGGGRTIVRGGGYGQEAKFCKSGWRMKDGNHQPDRFSYANWGFRAAMTPQADQTASEITLELGDGVKLQMVYIKPGSFVMGGENTWDNRFGCVELPKHNVIITKGFYLGKYEVTQGQYDAIMGIKAEAATKEPNYPAGGITIGNATKFCEKICDLTGRDVRLPTEAEWEYACRAGSSTEWFFGDDPAKLGDYAWFKDNDGKKPHPVGLKKPNPWGLYDICGNVFERVSDVYVKNYYANSPKEDPTGPAQFGGGTAFKYFITAPDAGNYTMTARVVTANYNQKLTVSTNGEEAEAKVEMPYTAGKWQDTTPVKLRLKKGKNALHFIRYNPESPQPHPEGGKDTLHFQRGVAIKSFTLQPVR